MLPRRMKSIYSGCYFVLQILILMQPVTMSIAVFCTVCIGIACCGCNI